jgi:tRNA (guanine-N7-)-methyltransferase
MVIRGGSLEKSFGEFMSMKKNSNDPHGHAYRKIWGRRQVRPLKDNQRRLLETVLPQIQITLSPGESISPLEHFPHLEKFCLEVGFGGGEHLSWRAQQSPDTGFIGCEPFITGVTHLLEEIETHTLSNIRIVNDDARLLVAALPDGCLERIYILFPDPWPKKRHNKRRIVHDETIGEFSRILKVGGELIMATDIEEYALWMQEVLEKRPEFTLQMGQRSSLHERPEPWPLTRYEQKGIKDGRSATFLVYILSSVTI